MVRHIYLLLKTDYLYIFPQRKTNKVSIFFLFFSTTNCDDFFDDEGTMIFEISSINLLKSFIY